MRTPVRPLRAKFALFLFSILMATAVLVAGPASASATQNPIAAYSLDEASGVVVHDLYGNHDGEIENGATENDLPEWSQGKYGSALWFEGKGYQCVTVPHSPDLELTEDFTIETWVKPEGSGEQEPLIVKEAPTFESHTAYMLYLGLEESGEIGGYVEEPGWERPEVSSKQLPIGKWSHLALTFDGTNLQLYINGALVDTSAAEGAQPSEGPLKFACAEVFGHDYKGKLDEVRIYDRAISGEEVGTDMNTELQTPAVSQQPVAAYSFDKGEGTIAEDLAGERDATIEGATWTSQGRFGGSLEFDGVNDVVSIPASPGLHIEEEFTLEAWVRPAAAEEEAPLMARQAEGSEAEPYFLYAGGWEAGVPFGGTEPEAGKGNLVIGEDPLPAKAWSHLALSFDGARARLYVDGVLVDENAAGTPPIIEARIEIGAATELGEYFKGRIDEVRIYNRALGAGEIGADMGTGIETGPTGPVAAFAFDEGEGSTALDTTGNEHEATLEGPSWARGRYGGGLEFNAAQKDAVTIAASPQLDFEEEFTLEAWVRPSTAENKYAPLIVHQTTGSEAQPYFLYEGSWESNLPYGGLEGETENETYSDADDQLPQQAWSHVALTFDGAKTRLYVNGELVDEDAGTPPAVSEGNLEIGGASEQDNYFDGRIDEVRLYDRALSEGEIQVSKATPIQTPQQGPVAAYSFDQGEGSTLEDLSGGEHTGTIAGATWARGRFGDALEFDGEEDCVTIPKVEDLQFAEEFTLEAWVRPVGSEEDARPAISMADESASGEEAPYAYDLRAGQNEVPKAWVRKGGEAGFRGAYGEEPLPESAWSHIALTDDGSVIRLYVDGKLGTAESSTNVAPLLTTAEGPLQIGCDVFGASFKGRIDEVRIYNRAVGAGEIGGDMGTGIEAAPSGPVAAYAFDEGEGETAGDATGNEHTATLEGPSWTTHGRYGGGLEFNAAQGDKVTIPASPQLDFSEEFTLEAWVRPSTAENKYAPLIVHQATGSEAQPYFLYEGSWEPDLPYGGLEANTPQESYSHAKEPLPQKAWSHLALTFDGAKARLYVNGQLVDEGAGSPPSVSEGNLEIGAASEVGSYFDGRIDEVRLYDRALSEGEIQVSKSSPIQTPQQGPVAAYSFDEGEGSTVEDLSGGGHTGTIEGAEWANHGRYGRALEFDGGTDCVKVPATEDLQFTEEFTLEAWVRPVGWEEEALPVISMADENSPGKEEPFAYELLAGQNEVPKAWVRKGGAEGFQGIYGEEPLPQKAWSHLALTDDGAYLRLYVDGELLDTRIAPDQTAAEGPLEIGCGPVNGGFKGRIDEVRIYNRALDGEEIKSTLYSTFPVATTLSSEESESNQAVMTGTVKVRGEGTDYFFEYGPTTSYGNIATGEELEGEDEIAEAEDVAINLTPETTYHYRIVAEGPMGIAYGEDQEFITGERVMTTEEEEEETAAEEAPEEELPSFASPSALMAPADFLGMMWTGKISKMVKHNTFDAVENSGAKGFRFVAGPGADVITALNQAKSHNLVPLPFLGSGYWPKPGSDAAENFVNYAKHAVETYGPGTSYDVDTWEMWNEPNMRQPIDANANPPVYEDTQYQGKVRPKEFAEFYKEVVEGIRSVKKGVHIVGPGLFGYRSNVKEKRLTPRAFLKQFNEALETKPKLEEPYGTLSLHPYRFKTKIKKGEKLHVPKNEADAIQVRKEVKSMIAGVHSLQAKQLGGSKPIWITELGFPVRSEEGGKPSKKIPAVSESEQKLLLRQTFWALLHSPARLEVDRAFYYNIEDRPAERPGENGGAWDHHSGLLTEDKRPRPAWTVYSNLAGGEKCPHSEPC